jgi:hypothetical protein
VSVVELRDSDRGRYVSQAALAKVLLIAAAQLPSQTGDASRIHLSNSQTPSPSQFGRIFLIALFIRVMMAAGYSSTQVILRAEDTNALV